MVDGEEAVEFEGEVDGVGEDDIEANKGADIEIGLLNPLAELNESIFDSSDGFVVNKVHIL